MEFAQFEYLAVLVSIVIGMGMSELVLTWGQLLRQRAQVRFYWLHSFWCVFTMVLMIQLWWGLWNFRFVEVWTFFDLLAVATETMVMVMMAQILVPARETSPPIDLKVYLFEHIRLFFALFAVLLILLTAVDYFVGGQPFFHIENLVRGGGVGLCLFAASTANERIHIAIAVIAAVLLSLFLTVAIAL